jgi:hypothetical protein
MPIARDAAFNDDIWIPRQAEDTFKQLLADKKTCVQPIVGGGGPRMNHLIINKINGRLTATINC